VGMDTYRSGTAWAILSAPDGSPPPFGLNALGVAARSTRIAGLTECYGVSRELNDKSMSDWLAALLRPWGRS